MEVDFQKSAMNNPSFSYYYSKSAFTYLIASEISEFILPQIIFKRISVSSLVYTTYLDQFYIANYFLWNFDLRKYSQLKFQSSLVHL